MVLWVDVCSALFMEALLFDFDSGDKTGEISASSWAADAILETINTPDLESFIVFGIIGGTFASLVTVFMIWLFEKAMRKENHIKQFQAFAKRRTINMEDLNANMPVNMLKFEVLTLQTQHFLIDRHYEMYAERCKLQNKMRDPVEKDIILQMTINMIRKIEALIKKAKGKEKYSTRSDFMRIILRREDRKKREVGFLLHYLGEADKVFKTVDKQILIQNMETYKDIGGLNVNTVEGGLVVLLARSFAMGRAAIANPPAVLHLLFYPFLEMITGGIRGYVFWNFIVDDKEKFDFVKGANLSNRNMHRVFAWSLSISWSLWCMYYLFIWILASDNVDVNGEQLLDPNDWMKSFVVGLAFDFILFAPFGILLRFVVLPLVAMLHLGRHVSAGYLDWDFMNEDDDFFEEGTPTSPVEEKLSIRSFRGYKSPQQRSATDHFLLEVDHDRASSPADYAQQSQSMNTVASEISDISEMTMFEVGSKRDDDNVVHHRVGRPKHIVFESLQPQSAEVKFSDPSSPRFRSENSLSRRPSITPGMSEISEMSLPDIELLECTDNPLFSTGSRRREVEISDSDSVDSLDSLDAVLNALGVEREDSRVHTRFGQANKGNIFPQTSSSEAPPPEDLTLYPDDFLDATRIDLGEEIRFMI